MIRFLILFLLATSAFAQVRVIDGDTLVINGDTVRLAEIDAPEMNQPYGVQAKHELQRLCEKAEVKIDLQGPDRYGRTLAQVSCNGKNANAAMVASGSAWVFDRYVREDSHLYVLQRRAQVYRRGLWADGPIPPWQWRRK